MGNNDEPSDGDHKLERLSVENCQRQQRYQYGWLRLFTQSQTPWLEETCIYEIKKSDYIMDVVLPDPDGNWMRGEFG